MYFMMYENSVEQQQYLSSIKAEMDAFKKLIAAKEHMVYFGFLRFGIDV